MEILLPFMVAAFVVVPGFILAGLLFIYRISMMMGSAFISSLGQIFCPVNEVREKFFSELFDELYAEDEFFGSENFL